jgi:hypothetical protein
MFECVEYLQAGTAAHRAARCLKLGRADTEAGAAMRALGD